MLQRSLGLVGGVEQRLVWEMTTDTKGGAELGEEARRGGVAGWRRGRGERAGEAGLDGADAGRERVEGRPRGEKGARQREARPEGGGW